MNFARTRVGGDCELLRQIVEIVHADIPEIVTRLRSAVAFEDRKELSRAVHSLQGMLATFNAQAVLDALKPLAEMAQAGDFSASGEALREFEEKILRFDGELSDELAHI